MAMIRTFVATPLPADLAQEVSALIGEMRQAGAKARWATGGEPHLTLSFLGDLSATRVGDVCKAVQRAAAGRPRFTVAFGGVGAFPSRERPRVLWVGAREGEQPLIELQEAITDELIALNFAPDRRRYHPHITLGRVGRDDDAASLGKLIERWREREIGEARVSEVLVMSSELTRSGPIHEVMGRVALGR